MNVFNRESPRAIRNNIGIIVAAGATVLGAMLAEQNVTGPGVCEPSHEPTSWITAPLCEIPVAMLGLDASDAPQVAR